MKSAGNRITKVTGRSGIVTRSPDSRRTRSARHLGSSLTMLSGVLPGSFHHGIPYRLTRQKVTATPRLVRLPLRARAVLGQGCGER